MASAGLGIELEQLTIFTPLGIRFWDQTTDQPVTDGLTVSAQLPNTGYRPVPAFRSASGVYAFQGLPCLHDVEYPLPGATPSASPPKSFSFVITVSDTLGRFLPALFVVDLPLSYPGVFLSNQVTSPPGGGARAYLFPAPTRPAAAGIGVIRADLWDREADQPAAYAAVEAWIAGQTWRGIADDRGCVLIQFPSPPVTRLSTGSPPGSGQGPATGMSWPIQIGVQYQPSRLRYPLAATRDVVFPWATTPSLKSILEEQQPALVWQHEAGPAAAEWTGDLVYGEELILRTAAGSPSNNSSVLLVSSIASSP
jgi:hypothetical protein